MQSGSVTQSRKWPFVGIPTFLRSEFVQDLQTLDADIAIIGAPTDEGSPLRGGARFAPRSIREQSMRFGEKGYYDINEKREFLQYELSNGRMADVGDTSVLVTNIEGTFQNITDVTRQVLDRGALPVVLGGDHAVSFPVVRAYSDNVYVVHFDAHVDYAPFMHGFEYTNGHAFRHIHHLNQVDGLMQVGIRSLRNPRNWVEDSLNDGNRVVTMEEFRDVGLKNIVEELPEDAKCYVSIDIDVLDMPLVPGCVSAEPNGMRYDEMRDALFALAEYTDIVGFDLVEVNPEIDVGPGVTSYLAAHTVLEFLARITDQPRWIARRENR